MRVTIDLTVEEMKALLEVNQESKEGKEEPDLLTVQDLERTLLLMADKAKQAGLG